MKKLVAFFVIGFLMLHQTINSQSIGCGTQPFKDPWLTEFQKSLDISTLRNSTDTLLYVPIALHVVGEDSGSGYFPVGRILKALCRLNMDFEEVNIHFFILDSIRYINNSDWASHPDIHAGAEMMFTNNIADAINCYIVSNPAGNCGYNLPYAGVALSKSCLSPNDHTWAHEIGHNLSLPHPFLGWEGGQTHDGTKPPVFGQPAPAFVTYDYTLFKDVYYPDTLIIDTALVELVDRSNCRESADGFCDTHPDYLAVRWPCDGDSLSATSQLDPNGQSFVSDGRHIMSYATDGCNKGFTPEQILAMRANLQQQKPGHLKNQSPAPILGSSIELILPLDDKTIAIDDLKLEWSKTGESAHYLVEVSRLSNFGFLETEIITSDTSMVISDLVIGRKYYWRVTPFDFYNFCASTSETRSFTVGESTSNENIGYEDVAIYQNGEYLYVSKIPVTVERIDILDANGRSVKFKVNTSKILDTESFYVNDLPVGLYFVRLQTGDDSKTIKTFIH